jgi:hypothetical protein
VVLNRDPNSNASGASRNRDVAADLRFERDITALYRLGPRAIAEACRHLGATSYRQTEVEQVVARYAALDPDVVLALEGNRFPKQPTLRVVGGRHGSR